MIGRIFKAFFKIAFVAGLLSAVLAVVCYFTDRQSDYIEIYNDEDDYYDAEDEDENSAL